MRDKPVEEIKYKGFVIQIFQDENYENPRDWDNFGKMICFHRKYTLGDEHTFADPEEFEEFWEKYQDTLVVLPLYLYDHSGLSMSTGSFNDRWDSGQIGYIYCTNEDIAREYGQVDKETKWKARKLMEGEVETYDQYLIGDVYGYVIEDERIDDGIDSCWGFYGTERAISEGKSVVDYYVKKHEEDVSEIESIEGLEKYLILV